MSRLTSFLRSKYMIHTNASSWRTSVALGVGIFLFLYLLQPFGISRYRGSIFLMCLGFCVMTIGVQWLCTFLFFRRPAQKKMPVTNGYMIIYSVAIEFCVGYLSDALCCFLLPHTVVMAALLGVLLLDLPCLGNRYGYLYVVKL